MIHTAQICCQGHRSLLEPSNTGWEKLSPFSKDSGGSQRGRHTAFYHMLFSSGLKASCMLHWLEVALWTAILPRPCHRHWPFLGSGECGFLASSPEGQQRPQCTPHPKFSFWKTLPLPTLGRSDSNILYLRDIDISD